MMKFKPLPVWQRQQGKVQPRNTTWLGMSPRCLSAARLLKPETIATRDTSHAPWLDNFRSMMVAVVAVAEAPAAVESHLIELSYGVWPYNLWRRPLFGLPSLPGMLPGAEPQSFSVEGALWGKL